jgi:translation initiation factor IF-1
MMNLEKTKKRGRPAQLLKVAELHCFVEFLLEKDPRTELQNQVIDVLQAEDFNFELLSEAQQILVKEALKPYREHLKITLLFEELNNLPLKTEYEQKIVDLYQDDQKGNLDLAERNILKTMCTRYYRFKAQQLQLKDLELYLSQIQKKDAGKKRKAENQRKFEVGGGVLSIYKIKNDDPLDVTALLNRISSNAHLAGKLRQSKIFKRVWALDLDAKEKSELLFEVLDQLALYGNKGETVKFVDFAIEKAQTKLKTD